MYKIAICDDEIGTCSCIENYLLEYGKMKNIVIDSEVFYSGEKLCGYLENYEKFDLIFLDIELGKINGIEVGHILREQRNDDITQVVFISSKENYAMELFKIRPFDFLVKPITYKHIEQVMNIYIKLCGKKNTFFEYQIGKRFYKIVEKEIVFLRSNAKKIEIFTVNGVYEFYGKMSIVQKQLNENQFWCVHKSYIINSDFISEYRVNDIALSTGDIIPISQTHRNTIKEKIIEMQITRRN